MKSAAEELMEFCHDKGFGKIGEDLFYGLALNDLRKFESLIFRESRGGGYERTLTGVAFEHAFVEIQVRGDKPSDCVSRLESIRSCIEGEIKGWVSDGKMHYECAFATVPPRLLTFNNEDKYMYVLVLKVMRRPSVDKKP